MNRVEMPDALFASIDEAADLVRFIGSAGFGLLFDIYHVAMNGDDIARAWAAHGHIAPHVQSSDAPGRNEPDRKRVDEGNRASVTSDLGGRRTIQNKPHKHQDI